MTSSHEKRKYCRVPFTTRIDIVMEPHGENIILSAELKDLSLGGIFVQTERKFPEGTPCDVIIYLAGTVEGITLQIHGKIVRRTETGVGIVFDVMDLDTYTHVKNIVRYNSNEDERQS